MFPVSIHDFLQNVVYSFHHATKESQYINRSAISLVPCTHQDRNAREPVKSEYCTQQTIRQIKPLHKLIFFWIYFFNSERENTLLEYLNIGPICLHNKQFHCQSYVNLSFIKLVKTTFTILFYYT